MARYIDADVLYKEIHRIEGKMDFHTASECLAALIKTPNADVVSAKAYEQFKWERDMAIEQLQSYGVGFGENKELAEVKHGHWIWLEGNLYECSECPNRTEVDEAMNEPLYIYCPYCGAKMDGGKKE